MFGQVIMFINTIGRVKDSQPINLPHPCGTKLTFQELKVGFMLQ